MTWDSIWEEVFTSRAWGDYPSEELVRFCARNFYGATDRSEVEILEIGCGPGANLWYLAREGFTVYGIDGSTSAVEQAGARLMEAGLNAALEVGDLTEGLGFGERKFDSIVDLACLQCNASGPIGSIVDQCFDRLKPGGKMLSLCLATGSSGEGQGRQIDDRTWTDIPLGPLKGAGVSHFFTRPELERLYSLFAKVEIESLDRSFDGREHWYRSFIVVATK